MLAAICCDRGAPGSTTAALALASARGLPAVVVEADPYGGDLPLRCRPQGRPLTPTPTILGLGTGRVASPPTEKPGGHTQPVQRLDLWRGGSHALSPQVRVVPGVMHAEQAGSLSWPTVAETCANQTVPVFADLGRIHNGSPSLPLASAADVVITVCRDDMASVEHMVHRLEQLVPVIADHNHRPPIVVPVVVADRRHGKRPATYIAELLARSSVAPTVRGVGTLTWDSAAVAALEEGADPQQKPLRGSALMKSARDTLGLLANVTGLQVGPVEPATKPKRRRRKEADESATIGPIAPAAPQPADPPGPNWSLPARAGQEH